MCYEILDVAIADIMDTQNWLLLGVCILAGVTIGIAMKRREDG